MASAKSKDADEILRKIQEDQSEFWKGMRKLEEGQRKLQESQLKTEESLRETNGNFNNKWGSFMQSLVKGDFDKLLRSRGIKVNQTSQSLKIKRDDGSVKWQFDLIAVNGEEVVLAEVKTMLTSEDVDYFLEKLEDFKSCSKTYGNKTIYGAVAYLDEEGAAKYAQRNGLFTIEAVGATDIAVLTNSEDFCPKKF